MRGREDRERGKREREREREREGERERGGKVSALFHDRVIPQK